MSQRILYLDQNAWIELARGAWDRTKYPCQHAALSIVIDAIKSRELLVPLSFTNIYETHKINDPVQRANLARVQATISAGRVIRGRRRIFSETLKHYLATRFSLPIVPLPRLWFLSELWFESVADYTPERYGYEISSHVLEFFRVNPAEALYDYLTAGNEEVRIESVRRFSTSSVELIARLEANRNLAASDSMAVRRRIYGARILINELNFVIAIANELGLPWKGANDIGSSLARSLIVEVPVLNVERELAVRLEDQVRPIAENDLRDMDSFTTALPLADVVVAEKPFVNLARQGRLNLKYKTRLLTSVFELNADIL